MKKLAYRSGKRTARGMLAPDTKVVLRSGVRQGGKSRWIAENPN